MSNVNKLRQFIVGAGQKSLTANSDPDPNRPVTRAEFNTLALAVNGLVEDFAAATSTEKMTEAMNAAVKPLLAGLQTNGSGVRGQFRAPLALPAEGEGWGAQTLANGRRDRGFIPPADDNPRKPLALKADGYKLPEGD